MSVSRRINTGNYAPPGSLGTSVASSSHASLALQVCSSPQSGHRILPATSGSRLNTDGSVSISVETARPERGQRIITPPIATLPDPQNGCCHRTAVTQLRPEKGSPPKLWSLWITIFDFFSKRQEPSGIGCVGLP